MRRALVLIVTAALIAAIPASAGRPARTAETKGIHAAVVQYVRITAPTIKRIKWYAATVSTVDAAWAVVGVDGFNRAGVGVGYAAALLIHTATGPWHVLNFGSSDLGCGAPMRVRRDLKLDCYERSSKVVKSASERFPVFWKTPGEAVYCRGLAGPTTG